MKTHRTILAFTFAIAFLATASARAGQKGMDRPAGPLQHILEHAKDLDLSADQRTKIEALIKESAPAREGAMREKMKDNPEMRREMKEARQSGDEAKMKAAREKMRDEMMKDPKGGKDGGPEAKRGEVMQKVSSILTPQQMQKLKEIRENQQGEGGPRRGGREGAGAGGGEKGTKPDASKGVPSIFE